ncbi:MAG: rRNA maturation RNase YbeY [Lachnospiraceae bacterium]|nr:rRNA maturation RNase YbeY [Lachnospiraceae bacterium]
MIYNFDSEVNIDFDFDHIAIYKNVVDAVINKFDCQYDCEVNLLIVDNDSIREINKETREIDKATDVLSFPNNLFSVPGDFNCIDENDDVFEPDSGELILGDIVISKEKVKSQALEYGHSEMREYAFLICHSMLHLIGFDHMEDEERIEMEKYQNEIMENLNILR